MNVTHDLEKYKLNNEYSKIFYIFFEINYVINQHLKVNM